MTLRYAGRRTKRHANLFLGAQSKSAQVRLASACATLHRRSAQQAARHSGMEAARTTATRTAPSLTASSKSTAKFSWPERKLAAQAESSARAPRRRAASTNNSKKQRKGGRGHMLRLSRLTLVPVPVPVPGRPRRGAAFLAFFCHLPRERRGGEEKKKKTDAGRPRPFRRRHAGDSPHPPPRLVFPPSLHVGGCRLPSANVDKSLEKHLAVAPCGCVLTFLPGGLGSIVGPDAFPDLFFVHGFETLRRRRR